MRANEFVTLLNTGKPELLEAFVGNMYAETFRSMFPIELHVEFATRAQTEVPDMRLKQVVLDEETRFIGYFRSEENQSWLKVSVEVENFETHLILGLQLQKSGSPLARGGVAISADARNDIVSSVGSLMAKYYVFPALGNSAQVALAEALASRAYDEIDSREKITERLTSDLQRITKDKHIRVFECSPSPPRQTNQEHAPDETGFVASKVLEGNIGYIDTRFFAPVPIAKPGADAAMRTIEGTAAIIFDMRKNGGGSADGVRYLCSYLFDKEVHLNSLYWRHGDRTDEYWTHANVGGNKRPKVPVFVLTSKRTFSGAEEFTYNLQTQKRATIVGETTGGGANPGDTYEVVPGLEIFVSGGRAINPITGTNWEGCGVAPDVQVPADEALSKAIELATAEIAKTPKRPPS